MEQAQLHEGRAWVGAVLEDTNDRGHAGLGLAKAA